MECLHQSPLLKVRECCKREGRRHVRWKPTGWKTWRQHTAMNQDEQRVYELRDSANSGWACMDAHQNLCIDIIESSLLFPWYSFIQKWENLSLILVPSLGYLIKFIWFYFEDEWMNENLVTRVEDKNWIVIYSCQKKEKQFPLIDKHWAYQPLQHRCQVQRKLKLLSE